jgi:hypothetical protein
MTGIPEFNFIFSDDNSILKPIGWSKLKKRIDKQLERADKVIARSDKVVAKIKSERLRSEAKIEAEQLTSANNGRNLPSNATVRKEYVRCGKIYCTSKHGPYYYAYWKDDSGKLKKKYIGKYHPPLENTNKAKSSDIDHASSDTLTNPSNSAPLLTSQWYP